MDILRPEPLVSVLLAGTYGFFFHSLVGTRIRSIPLCLLASIAGFGAGVLAALLVGLSWPSLGGVPVLPASAGSILFLLVAKRVFVC